MSDGHKKRRSVTLDETVDEVLKDHPNASALVNALVEEYEFVGSSREAALNKRIAEKEAELREAREKRARIDSRIDKLDREITQLRDDLHGLSDEERKAVRKVAELCEPDEDGRRRVDPEDLTADSQVVELRASKVGMDPEVFVQEVKDRL
jgi:septal ring factor EnvC (AmiA/AmiB activator)